MRHLLLGMAATLAVIAPVRAQAPSPGSNLANLPPPVYPAPPAWSAVAPTANDAYRQGLITRWEFERLEGPLPPALQGPSPNGTRGVQIGQ